MSMSMDECRDDGRHSECCDNCCDRVGHTRPPCDEPCAEACVEMGTCPTWTDVRGILRTPKGGDTA